MQGDDSYNLELKTYNVHFTDIKTIAIAGAGAMGSGIAQVAAQAGYQTILYDVSDSQIEKSKKSISKNLYTSIEKQKLTSEQKNETLKRFTFTNNFNEVKADVIIEAVVEKLEIKQELFRQLAANNAPDCILASNTSSIPITRIAAAVPNPERVIGMHFFLPAYIMKLVEVISGAFTSKEVALNIKQLAEKMGKTPAMANDSPGFIVNRVARHYYVESLKTLEENVASFEDIDALMEASGFKMGRFRLMVLVGNDINFSVTSSLYESFHYAPKFRPSRIQQQKVEAGHLGRKTGKGFYDYEK